MKTNRDDFVELQIEEIRSADGSTLNFWKSGLTKREYFAAMAMQGLLTKTILGGDDYLRQFPIKTAIAYADELIKQLNATREEK